MAKPVITYVCSNCGYNSRSKTGKCPECGKFGTLVVDESRSTGAATSSAKVGTKTSSDAAPPSKPARLMQDIKAEETVRESTGLTELDRVLGGGIVKGSVMLLAGEPGVGKSSILALVSHKASLKAPVLYVSGEESEHQIKMRHQRMNAEGKHLYLASENDLTKILGQIDAVNPELIVVDSLQTIASPDIDGTAGSPSQVKEVATVLTRTAKSLNIPLIFVGHFTKDAQIAGPRVVEHLVDVVLSFEGQEDSTLRMLRGVKNRFGPSDEIGCFEHTETGLEEVPDPSGLLLDSRDERVSGVATSIFLEGKRALPVEIQALVTSTVLPNPRKVTAGLDHARTVMMQAVLQKHAKQRLGEKDVYISTISGIRVKEPAVDLATVMAIITANKGYYSRSDAVAIGEVTLSGRVKKVPGMQRRLAEAQRLGFTAAYVPPGTRDMVKNIKDLKLIEVKNVDMAVTFADLYHNEAASSNPYADPEEITDSEG